MPDSDNPYAVGSNTSPESPLEKRLPETHVSPALASLIAWFGTSLAGGLFGLIIGGLPGLFLGCMIATVGGLFISFLMFLSLLCFSRGGITRRCAIISSAACGGVTVTVTTTWLLGSSASGLPVSVLWAAAVGPVVPAVLATIITRSVRVLPAQKETVTFQDRA
jgi:hypothetical protein